MATPLSRVASQPMRVTIADALRLGAHPSETRKQPDSRLSWIARCAWYYHANLGKGDAALSRCIPLARWISSIEPPIHLQTVSPF